MYKILTRNCSSKIINKQTRIPTTKVVQAEPNKKV